MLEIPGVRGGTLRAAVSAIMTREVCLLVTVHRLRSYVPSATVPLLSTYQATSAVNKCTTSALCLGCESSKTCMDLAHELSKMSPHILCCRACQKERTCLRHRCTRRLW